MSGPKKKEKIKDYLSDWQPSGSRDTTILFFALVQFPDCLKQWKTYRSK